ncbi:hypothetical protein MUN77_02575 [Leucobacter allii]|uniref:LGFP repeat-containing protein n=1 Tax=Leucobacter allii TaxID=2932247 RepID=UPI001FD54CAB|nr:hypothetical protein [Leucobacter allii]UOR02236.1 hypothetical protein MUN77_02575 [Leucobacter allii]
MARNDAQATRGRGRHLLLAALALILGVAAVGAAPLAQPSAAQAASTQNFDAGNIISDALFYDGDDMSAAQIQSFLAQRLAATPDGRCTIGDPGRAAWSPWGSTFIASVCLKDATFTTTSRAANAYCKAYAGGSNQSVGQIIANVGKACSISPKVLLVMLEKEQSLVTDTWPTARQYDFAMGYDCPDSGPNNSANCNSGNGGFPAQMYRAAWQLQVYKSHPTSYNYRPFQTNTIQWHPNPGCGTSQVRIQNWATAALYIYTPYRPNQAALNAGWGTGDSCSSYGNRNFFLFYQSWFGSTQVPVLGGIKVIYDRNGGANGSYGLPLGARSWVSQNGGGWQQRFEGGLITESRALNRTFGLPNGAFLTAYRAIGGPASDWGFVRGNATGTVANGTRALNFQHGTTIYTQALGAKYMPSRIHHFWKLGGGATGPLGYPVGAATQPTSTSGMQKFERGTLMVSGSRSAVVTPTQLSQWTKLGGHAKLGYYTSTMKGGDTFPRRATERGVVYFVPGGSFMIATGEFSKAYAASGGPSGPWGMPAKAKRALAGGGSMITFANGVAVHSKATGVVFMTRPAYDDWIARGGPSGALGYPARSTQLTAGGSVQVYAAATFYYGPAKTVKLANGQFTAAYAAAGGPAGSWGWPTTGKRTFADGSSTVGFAHGTAKHVPGKGVTFTPSVPAGDPPDPVEDPGDGVDGSAEGGADGTTEGAAAGGADGAADADGQGGAAADAGADGRASAEGADASAAGSTSSDGSAVSATNGALPAPSAD